MSVKSRYDFKRIADIRRLKMSGRPLRSCYLGKVFRVDRLRNAYFGYQSRTWYTDASFCPSLEVAKRSVQNKRAKGTHWLITERPVVVLSFDTFGISVLSLSGWGSLEESGWKRSAGLSSLLGLLRRQMFFFKHDPAAVENLVAWPSQYGSWVHAGALRWTQDVWDERFNPASPIIAPVYFEILKAAWSLAKPREIRGR